MRHNSSTWVTTAPHKAQHLQQWVTAALNKAQHLQQWATAAPHKAQHPQQWVTTAPHKAQHLQQWVTTAPNEPAHLNQWAIKPIPETWNCPIVEYWQLRYLRDYLSNYFSFCNCLSIRTHIRKKTYRTAQRRHSNTILLYVKNMVVNIGNLPGTRCPLKILTVQIIIRTK